MTLLSSRMKTTAPANPDARKGVAAAKPWVRGPCQGNGTAKPHLLGRDSGGMAGRRFTLVARVSSANLEAVRPILESLFPRGSLHPGENELILEARADGGSAKELNRTLLSALRRVEKRTRLRAEWRSTDGTVQRFFDYVLKKTIKQ